ncbi:hypothetical protein BCR44DRAFT_1436339 [Catenaria anguillulae PL171]|uniref:Uncharacterized protein n=1 Tax=Catenaria anguillulae PL171 TaxID=765915 RepID=A0A1Y2HN12_9FUNG|nr:hypothetical protein BCR44DRAFT_1436339 [Catenaria anguillulae PL171]
MSLTINKDFGYVILGVTCTSRWVMALRKKYSISYPDMGCGIHAQKLDEKQWTEFNNAQRAHYNYLEQLPLALPLALFAGVFQPKIAAAGCITYIVGREFFCRGYMAKGSSGRFLGMPLMLPTLLTWLVLTVHGSVKMVGWI